MAISLPAVGTVAAILLVLTVLLWFTWGTQRNISKGNDLLRWLQTGLRELGPRATVRWLGSSAVELVIVEPVPPFVEVAVVVVLEPRDVPWFWAWSRRRGRRDFLIVRGRIDRPPGLELEIVDEAAWSGRDLGRELDTDAWIAVAAPADGPALRLYHAPGSDPMVVSPFVDRLSDAGGGVWRLSVRRAPPHLELHVLPPDLGATPASELLRTFGDLARAVRT